MQKFVFIGRGDSSFTLSAFVFLDFLFLIRILGGKKTKTTKPKIHTAVPFIHSCYFVIFCLFVKMQKSLMPQQQWAEPVEAKQVRARNSISNKWPFYYWEADCRSQLEPNAVSISSSWIGQCPSSKWWSNDIWRGRRDTQTCKIHRLHS